jgi:signal transduction histidine kinase
MSLRAEIINRRITRLAVGRHLPYRTVRLRLTLLYGTLFTLSSAALMAMTYMLLVNAGFVFSLPSAGGSTPASSAALIRPAPRFPAPGTRTHPSAKVLAHWRTVAVCMRRHGVTTFPDATTTVPRLGGQFGVISDHDGVIFAIPATINTNSAVYQAANIACGYEVPDAATVAADNRQRAQVRDQLLLESGIALVGMALLSLGLGWLMAGRVLGPLSDSYEAQRQFVANASHELRGPLTRQRALIQVALAAPDADASSLRAAHERVLASQEQLEQLISALLTLTRGQAGPESLEVVDLARTAAEVARTHEADAQAAGLSFDTTFAAADAQADRRLLERLLANVIVNAIRHNHVGGRVEVVTGMRDRLAFVSVSNTGPVVGPEQVERLLRPFERMRTARTGHDGGHGLGLSIVRAIADAHRAQLRLSPQPQGGMVVEVVFPTVPAASRRRLAGSRVWRRAPRTTLGD